MSRPIDFGKLFRERVAEQLRASGPIDEDAAEALAGRLYGEWADAPDARLEGLSPRLWFARLRSGEELTALLRAYAEAGVEIPELLLDRFDGLGAACAGALAALAEDKSASACSRAIKRRPSLRKC